ncbi:hypothetical protein SteCoe_16881 [Stentor coeruleus]|uniref:Uncharacterized protein n=1 Tax=Stentor coeruleus TaxID=5963 RepID=A0A1R2C0A8_9CILI|nr:hypothetical protein SteCoe_16881 [Stentor coeruleus]
MNWTKNPPPGVNPQYSSFHYQSGRYEPESEKPKFEDYKHTPGRPGGGWDGEDEVPTIKPTYGRNEGFMKAPEPSREYTQPRTEPRVEPPRESHPQPSRTGISVSEQAGVYEKVLIEEITAPGGVRPRPPDKDMHEFLNKCKYLSAEVVIPLLIILLDNPQRCFKSLCVIEKLVYEYENFADVTYEYLGKIQNSASNQAGQKIVAGIIGRYNSVPVMQNTPSNIIDLF